MPQSTKHATSHRIDHMNYTSTEVRRRPSETGGLISDGRKQLPDSNAVELQLDKDMRIHILLKRVSAMMMAKRCLCSQARPLSTSMRSEI